MIYYSVLYPPLLPITIPAFELYRNEKGEYDEEATWKLYFEPSIGNKITDFKGGFIRVRKAESEVSIFSPDDPNPYLYDMVPFRNPFAEYKDPYDSSLDEPQPPGFLEDMPKVLFDDDVDSYYINVPHSIFKEDRGHMDIRFKVQIMFTSDWLATDGNYGSGVINFYNTDLYEYEPIDKNNYFGGNLVEKGLSEWSRVTLVSPVSPAEYSLVYKFIDTDLSEPVGYLNSPIIEFLGERLNHNPKSGIDGNSLLGYKVQIFNTFENKPSTEVEDSGWIVGQENPNLEIRWQNEIELDDKTYYWVKLEVQTVWDLRKEFWQLCYTDFEASLFQGKLRAINDHDKARVKIVVSAKSPLTWGLRHQIELDPVNDGFVKIKNEVEDKDIFIEQGIDLTTRNASFAGEALLANIDPIQHWDEDPTRYFLRMSGPELSVHNPYQEEYLIYAHSVPISESNGVDIYLEDIIINPIMSSYTSNKKFETYMSPTGHMGLGDPEEGEMATGEVDDPVSHSYLLVVDDSGVIWRATLSDDGVFVTRRLYDSVDEIGEEIKPVYLYDRHNLHIKKLVVDRQGTLGLERRAIPYDIKKGAKQMFINEFRMVKRVWGLQLGRKTLIGKQTYKAFMTDSNRKLEKWNRISPSNHYYIYFASTKGQLYLYVKDLTAEMLGKNAIDRYNLVYGTSGAELPHSGLFLITEGLNAGFAPTRDEDGRPIKYSISVDEKGSLVSDIAYVGTSTTSQQSLRKK